MELIKVTIENLVDGPWRFTDAAAPKSNPFMPFEGKNAFKAAGSMLASFAIVGQLQPIYVRANPDGFPEYQIIDGHGRRDTAVEAGLSELDAILVEADDVQALSLYVQLNLTRLEYDHTKVATQLMHLANATSPDNVITLVPWPSHNVESYINLGAFDWHKYIKEGQPGFDGSQLGFFNMNEEGEDQVSETIDPESNGIA